MTGVDADLATLRHRLRHFSSGELPALARVEAELSRLREQRAGMVARDRYDALSALYIDMTEKRDAAEARCAELEEQLGTPYLRVLDQRNELAERCARLQQENERLDQFEYDLAYWQKAYPTSVFGEDLTDDEQRAVTQALESAGFTSDRVHASWARHITRSITEQYAPVKAAREALAGPDTPQMRPTPAAIRRTIAGPGGTQIPWRDPKGADLLSGPDTPADFRAGHFCQTCGGWVPGGDEHDCTPADSQECDHDYVAEVDGYRCEKCGQGSWDGIHPDSPEDKT